jgi:hypothetical protein
LDQNYLNNLTRARLGPGFYTSLPPNYFPLWETLISRVEDGSVICPFSDFRRSESELTDPSFERELYATMNLLWGEISFQNFGHIVQCQMNRALAVHLGLGEPAVNWAEAFDSNPQETKSDFASLEPGGGRFTEWTKHTREYHLARGDDPPVGNFSQQKVHEADQLIEYLYIVPAVQQLTGQIQSFTFPMLDFQIALMKEYDRLIGKPPSVTSDVQLALFLKSKGAKSIPFIDIHSSLRASMLVHTPDRNISGTDLDDVLALSALLPYAKIFTSDRHMKDIVGRADLAKKYGTRIFSARRGDIDELAAYLRAL